VLITKFVENPCKSLARIHDIYGHDDLLVSAYGGNIFFSFMDNTRPCFVGLISKLTKNLVIPARRYKYDELLMQLSTYDKFSVTPSSTICAASEVYFVLFGMIENILNKCSLTIRFNKNYAVLDTNEGDAIRVTAYSNRFFELYFPSWYWDKIRRILAGKYTFVFSCHDGRCLAVDDLLNFVYIGYDFPILFDLAMGFENAKQLIYAAKGSVNGIFIDAVENFAKKI